jgi:hypothetical protein
MDGTGEHHNRCWPGSEHTKIVCSLSYVDHSPKTNAVILLDMGHTPRGECAREKRKGKEI